MHGLNPTLVSTNLPLTPLQSQVAVWLAEGMTVPAIAARMGRKPGTVYWHLKRIYRRLGISRQAELVRLVLLLHA